MPSDRLAALAQTFPQRLEPGELWRALHAATDCFFETASRMERARGDSQSAPLREAMGHYLAWITAKPGSIHADPEAEAAHAGKTRAGR
ncbi:MAG: hypothetical protein H6650_11170 [Ardenticatenales bacterium]|nr:hypothetical protein [Ardenticatenales bacterium]